MFYRISQNTLIFLTTGISLEFIDGDGSRKWRSVKSYGIQNAVDSEKNTLHRLAMDETGAVSCRAEAIKVVNLEVR